LTFAYIKNNPSPRIKVPTVQIINPNRFLRGNLFGSDRSEKSGFCEGMRALGNRLAIIYDFRLSNGT